MSAYVVVGMGIQGVKRHTSMSAHQLITVDPVAEEVDFRRLSDVPLDSYEAVLLCVPDDAKPALIDFAIEHGKHVLAEKPLFLDPQEYADLSSRASEAEVTVYVAYNHRFEPHIAAAKRVLDSGEIGDIYTVSLSYGNGTAALVRASPWRDTGLGVIADLGSHLLDIVDFWWGLTGRDVDYVDARALENRSYDQAIMRLSGSPEAYLEATMLSWRNDFRCDIRGSEGSLHISSLCKWGPTSLTVRGRIRPSGRPDERTETLVQGDPTWVAEFAHFLNLISTGHPGNLSTSREIARILSGVSSRLELP